MKKIFIVCLLAFLGTTKAQEFKNQELFTIDNQSFYTDEFIRVYQKNLDLVKDDSNKDLNQYLELFLGYKLKITKANKLGLQNGTTYQNELKQYRGQLAKNYTSDSKVTNELLQEAYNRSLKELKASHILFMVDENAIPADTLKVYNQAIDVRNRALKGEDFGQLAVQFSQDPSAKDNKGNLGWFSALRMVYPFESAAYKLNKDEVSMPVRTRFGYHIIKLNDSRDNRGEVLVAHIMLMKPESMKSEEVALEKRTDPKVTIQELYKKLQQGEDFGTLADQFSDDKVSSVKGGQLQRFGSGMLSSEAFEDVAFSLKNKNDISEPFETAFGWHIVKLLDKYPVKTFTEVKNDLDAKIKRDERSKKVTNAVTEKLRTKYSIATNKKEFDRISKLVTNDFYEQKWTVPSITTGYNEILLTINNDKKYSSVSFLKYVENKQKVGLKLKPISALVTKLYNDFIDEELNTYYDANLETEFVEFKYVMDEYRDGLLLFDLMEKEIWDKAKTDSVGLADFYVKNAQKYQWKNRIQADIFSSTKKEVIEKVQKLIKQKKSIEAIKEEVNKDGVVDLIVKSGTYEEDKDVMPKFPNPKKGVTPIVQDGAYYFVLNVKDKLPAGVKELKDCKGKAINDYQQYLESIWVENLKKEFTVKVNTEVLENVKKHLKL